MATMVSTNRTALSLVSACGSYLFPPGIFVGCAHPDAISVDPAVDAELVIGATFAAGFARIRLSGGDVAAPTQPARSTHGQAYETRRLR